MSNDRGPTASLCAMDLKRLGFSNPFDLNADSALILTYGDNHGTLDLSLAPYLTGS